VPISGYSPKELADFKYTVYGNVITQMKVGSQTERAQRVSQVAAGGDSWTTQLADDIKELWSDTGIQRVYEMRDRKYHLNESASYFFDNITRIMQPDYIATYQDVLRARVRTTGIQEALFQFDNMRLRMLDVGGQRSERKKWIHCFPELDTQILTSRGFLWLHEVLAAVDWRPSDGADGSAVVVDDWRGLTVATYCESSGRIVYRTPQRLVVNAARAQRLVEFASDDDSAAQISVVATDQHQLYVHTAVDQCDSANRGAAARSFRKLTCADVLRGKAIAEKTAALDDAAQRERLGAIDSVSFLAAAQGGVACADAAAVDDDAQQTALLEAYGAELAAAVDDRVAEWALRRLDKRAVRRVLAGWQSARPGALFAANAARRDDLVRLLMHGGFTTTFALGFDEWSQRVGWHVQFAELGAVDASVRLTGAAAHVARERRLRDGRTWCFDMSSAPHELDGFVVVRRVRRVTREQFATLSQSLGGAQHDSDKQARVRDKTLLAASRANANAPTDARDWVVVSSSRPTIQGNCFDSVTCVLFVVSISEYDQTLREGKENRMLESLALFDDICNSKWFQNTAFILFLNKTDLFKKKIGKCGWGGVCVFSVRLTCVVLLAKIDMKEYCFPTYTGGADFEQACEFVKMRFFERNLSPHVIFGYVAAQHFCSF
jgi:hypothetical protein